MRVIAVVSTDEDVLRAIEDAAARLAGGSCRSHDATTERSNPPSVAEIMEATTSRARALLTGLDGDGASPTLILAPSVRQLGKRLEGISQGSVDVLVIDDTDHAGTLFSSAEFDAETHQLRTALAPELRWTSGAQGVLRVVKTGDLERVTSLNRQHELLVRPEDLRSLTSHVMMMFADAVQFGRASIRSRPPAPVRLSRLISELMDETHPERWDLRYFTGSVVSSLISDLEQHVAMRGSVAYRGPNEHSLAVSALARWQVDRVASVIVITSGMLDELRGALANLGASEVPVLIVCAEGRDTSWLGFQSTISAKEDMREVLTARRIRHIYARDESHLETDFGRAAQMFGESLGPVVLLASQDVLESPSSPSGQDTPTPPIADRIAQTTSARDLRHPCAERGVERLVDILQDPARDRVLLIAGDLDGESQTLVHRLARASGAAYADTLQHPGSLTPFEDAADPERYLGTIGLYGYSGAVHAYLHESGRPRSRSCTSLVFIGSPAGEIDTPFSEGALKRKFHITQVVKGETDVAPFAVASVVGDLPTSLRAILDKLETPAETVEARRVHADRAREAAPALSELIDVTPMTTDRFTHLLGQTVERRITNSGYTFTGVYDVGRGGISAIRNVPRTGRGFSGWFGRAAMGDAKASIPALALAEDRDVIGFIGDGAAQIGPDIIPSFVEHIQHTGRLPAGSTTIFMMNNGGLSLITSYREGRVGRPGGRQMRVKRVHRQDCDTRLGALLVRHRSMRQYDQALVEEALEAKGAITVIDVSLRHSNSGDGLSLIDALSWQYGDLSDLALTMASQRGATA